MQTPLDRLADRINEAISLLEGGWVTLGQAIELARPFKNITVPRDLFPNEYREGQLQNQLLVLSALCDALHRYRSLNVSLETRLRDIPLLTRGIRMNIDLALDGKPGAISFK